MRQLFLLVAILNNFAGCHTTKITAQTHPADSLQDIQYPAGGSEKLFASRWTFSEANGLSVQHIAGTEASHLAFIPGQVNRVAGFTGCNRLNGAFTLSANNAMKFAPLAMTRKMCADINAQEQAITTALQQVTNFYIVKGELLLVNDTKTVAKLRPQENATGSANAGQLSDEQLRNLNDMLLQGVDFMASGNEPFWSLQIDRRKGMKFKLVSGDSVSISVVTPVRLQDVAATSYRTSTTNENLTVIVYDQECINDMSGHKLPKKVEVTYKGKSYSGCGRYLSDYRLNDIWKMVSINDTALDTKKFKQGAPTLEFNLNEQQVMGHTGCNGIGGKVDVMGRYISIPRLTGTMMFCDDDGFEKRYIAQLSPGEILYEINNGMLTLYTGKDKLLFRKTD